jgi:hypothetical protein
MVLDPRGISKAWLPGKWNRIEPLYTLCVNTIADTIFQRDEDADGIVLADKPSQHC